MNTIRISIGEIWRILACCALVLPMSAGHAQAQSQPVGRHALLIGISKYDAYNTSGMFPNLDCDRDVQLMADVLKQKYGFTDKDITILSSTSTVNGIVVPTPEKTTKQAILDAIKQIVAETHSGDIVYIHYSGHGSQVLDSQKPDGLDSAIVPADYHNDQSSEDTSNEICGKTIASYLQSLQAVKPAQVVLSFDCCHSGDVSRGAAKKRGLTYAEYSDWYDRTYHRLPPEPKSNPQAHDTSSVALNGLDNKGYVLISACSNDELASETEDSDPTMGRLSKVLVHVLATANSTTTYRQVFDQINTLFEAKYTDQHPQIAGDRDTYLLGGTAPKAVNYVTVHQGGATGFVLDAGALQDVTIGSTYTIYRKDADPAKLDDSSKLTVATVSDTGFSPTSADLSITPAPADASAFAGARAVEKTHNYSLSLLKFDEASLRNVAPDQSDAVLAKLKDLSMVTTDYPAGTVPDVKLVKGETGNGKTSGPATVWLARGDTGFEFKQIDLTKDLASQISDDLDREARYRYVLGMNPPASIQSGAVSVDIRLVSATQVKDQYGDVTWAPDDNSKTSPHNIGDYFMIEVRNTGNENEHVTVLDIDSDGTIALRWPESGGGEDDNLVSKGQTWIPLWLPNHVAEPAVYKFDTPDPGGEFYKAIATDSYVDLSGLARGERGPTNPFDQIAAPALTGTRGSDTVAAPTVWDTAETKAVVVAPAP